MPRRNTSSCGRNPVQNIVDKSRGILEDAPATVHPRSSAVGPDLDARLWAVNDAAKQTLTTTLAPAVSAPHHLPDGCLLSIQGVPGPGKTQAVLLSVAVGQRLSPGGIAVRVFTLASVVSAQMAYAIHPRPAAGTCAFVRYVWADNCMRTPTMAAFLDRCVEYEAGSAALAQVMAP
ncbi:hypothetical protein MAPG_10304 [Magnaporthiopsis poae ATCC 64411]|uniref:Uncharacterized protein n=1 Tax=Magnaporthiopsis poae (strain ATCC 64411 / 73-15) TaxID=644358 RepID=A0A0C4EC90_MAGP6|nr:hypothetical protein MAPG_10304 [Magnaporthiopsis poae ATCC 64411]